MINAKSIAVLFACCVLANLAGSTEAVKCYVCTSAVPGCGDAFDASKLTTANEQNYCGACIKVKATYNGQTGSNRACFPTTALYDGCKTLSGVTSCFCNTDLCNSSIRVSTTKTLLALPVLAYIVFRLSFL